MAASHATALYVQMNHGTKKALYPVAGTFLPVTHIQSMIPRRSVGREQYHAQRAKNHTCSGAHFWQQSVFLPESAWCPNRHLQPTNRA
jgi:hypothetical protein